ncbi:MAG: TIGR02584 family CRISPR-associated protein [Pontiellaceae bacterium]|nr:TIGR02584 family CRISPR-associated protein [Pontiellaceae bacterium]
MDHLILVAVVGNSPAVLTETVWALAQEDPPVVPDEVVAITTLAGRARIREQLFGTDAVWGSLRSALGAPEGKLHFGAEDTIKVIGDGDRDFADIATPQENEQAADFILRVLRQHTEDPSTIVIASIAGGRKTMSALMLACMSLLGREQDRVCHVLANEEYIKKNPGFCFPENKREEKAADIQLSDIPFIRVRGWYEQESGKVPASYSHMVSLFRKAAPEAIVEEPVVFDSKAKTLWIGDAGIPLSENEYCTAETFVRDRRGGHFSPLQELIDGGVDANDTFRRNLSSVRNKIKQSGYPDVAKRLLPDAKARNYLYRNIQFRPRRPRTSEK